MPYGSLFSEATAHMVHVQCGFCCCLCHTYCGPEIHLHPLVPEAGSGADDPDNCLPLCADCLKDIDTFHPRHPQRRKFTIKDLRSLRDAWYTRIAGNEKLAARSAILAGDIELFAQLNTEYLKQTVTFLPATDFSQAINTYALEGLENFQLAMEYSDPPAVFINTEMEAAKTTLAISVAAFYESLKARTVIHAWFGPHESHRIPPHWRYDHPEQYQEAINELETLARQISDHYAIFVRTAERLLNVMPSRELK